MAETTFIANGHVRITGAKLTLPIKATGFNKAAQIGQEWARENDLVYDGVETLEEFNARAAGPVHNTIQAYVEQDVDGDLSVCEMNGSGLAWLPASFFAGNGIYDETNVPFFGYDIETAHVTRIVVELLARSGYTCDENKLYRIIKLIMEPGPARDHDPSDYYLTLTAVTAVENVPAI